VPEKYRKSHREELSGIAKRLGLKERSVTFEQRRSRLERMLREGEAERGIEKKTAQNEQRGAATIQKKVDEFLRKVPEVVKDIQAQNIAKESLEWMILVGEAMQGREGHDAPGHDKALARARRALGTALRVMVDTDKLQEKQAAELYEIVFPKGIDWDARYEAYLKASPTVAGAVKSGKITQKTYWLALRHAKTNGRQRKKNNSKHSIKDCSETSLLSAGLPKLN
jgi:hypothetical protein